MLLRARPGADQRELEAAAQYHLPIRGWRNSVPDSIRDGIGIAALPLDITFPDLVNAAAEGETFDRQVAIQRLAWFGPKAAPAVPALIGALSTEELVEVAAEALGKIGPSAKDAIPALQAVPEDSLDKYWAEQAIEKIMAQ